MIKPKFVAYTFKYATFSVKLITAHLRPYFNSIQNDLNRVFINLHFRNQATISGEFHYDRSRPPAACTHVSLYHRNNCTNLARLYGGDDQNGQREYQSWTWNFPLNRYKNRGCNPVNC